LKSVFSFELFKTNQFSRSKTIGKLLTKFFEKFLRFIEEEI